MKVPGGMNYGKTEKKTKRTDDGRNNCICYILYRPDNWTAVTADGKRSAQFEHTMLVTETGVEILT